MENVLSSFNELGCSDGEKNVTLFVSLLGIQTGRKKDGKESRPHIFVLMLTLLSGTNACLSDLKGRQKVARTVLSHVLIFLGKMLMVMLEYGANTYNDNLKYHLNLDISSCTTPPSVCVVPSFRRAWEM